MTDETPFTQRKMLSEPSDWWEAFEQAAAKAGMSLSEWMGEAAKEKLPARVRKKLSERPGLGARFTREPGQPKRWPQNRKKGTGK